MMNYNNMRALIVLVLLFLKGLEVDAGTNFTLSLGNYNINAMTSYTWAVTFTDFTTRTWMMLTFPSAAKLTADSLPYINTVLYPVNSFTSNTINISTSLLTISNLISIVITNVTNPYSAQTSVTSFYFASNIDTSFNLALTASKDYYPGVLTCGWSFDLCTEQTNSQLAITLNTVNPIPIGSSIINVGFPTIWVNQFQKSLLSDVGTLTCSIKFNGGSLVTTGVTCPYSTGNIKVAFFLSSPLNGNDQIIVYIQGVMSPPTATTPLDTQYTTTTSDTPGNIIDGMGGAACVIAPTCVTNFTDGIFYPSPLPINTQATTLTVTFNDYPTISFLKQDTVVMTYSDSANINSCSLFKVIRNNNAYLLSNNSTGAIMSYYFSTTLSSLPNNNYGFAISIYMECAVIKTPSSQTPSTFLFTFKRNNAAYMELTGTFTATATLFNAANGLLTPSNYEMASIGTRYLFTFTNGQPLGSTPAFVLTFPPDISLSGVTCSIGVNSALLANNCTSSSTSLTINYSSGSAISTGSAITIQVSGITNPILTSPYQFGLTTYYTSSVSTSKVEYNTAAFTTTFTTITNLAIVLTPASFSVYTFTAINMTFSCPLTIPALSTFSILFPTDVTQITPPTQPLLINGTPALLKNDPITSGSTVTFTNLQAIALGSSLIITISIRTPNYMKTFPSIQLSANQNSSILFQSLSSMTIPVTSPGTMPVVITPYYSLTGATSSYLITLTLSIPHPGTFTLEVAAGTDTKFITGSATCTSICSGLSPLGANGFSVTVNNPYPNSTSPANIDLNISSFINSRNIGAGLVWTIATKTTSTDSISSQTAYPTISVPNLLTGNLQSTQFYFRNNTNTVKLYLTLTNLLISTDYILFSMDRTTYNVYSTIACASLYGTCSLDAGSTTNVLIVRVIPNPTNLLSNPLEIWIEGLISGANTYYLQTDYITVGTYNLNGTLIDQGKITYNISCRDNTTLSKNCKTCSGGACIDCYLSQGYYLNGTTCVTSCGDATNYLSFANNVTGACQSCTGSSGNCLTCVNSTACLTCINTSYYLYTSTLTCNLICPTNTGYFATSIGGVSLCVRCADSNCLICSSTSYGTCTLCSNGSVLVSGICSSSCSSTSTYVVNGQCVACDQSCFTCSGSGNRSCIQCTVNYYNSSGVCSQTCPTGLAIILSLGSCGCAASCLTCDSNNYANCTACLNTSLFVYNGLCVPSCPTSSYLSGTSCIACSSGCTNCTSSACLTCTSNWFIFGTQCYSDCNIISQQYDTSGVRCVLCPTGCDTCLNGACKTCLSEYSFLSSSSSCVLTCELTSSCTLDTSNILPMPGTLAVLVWLGVVVIVHVFSHKNYIPYSLILFTAVVEFILVIAVISQSSATVSRLLTYLQSSTKSIILGLLAITIVINYLTNAIYLFIFIRYIKPLIINPKQIDVISNIVILVIATLTNYRFAIVAFAKMFPKPSIHIEMAKDLTPVHYLCLGSVVLSIFPIIAAGIGLSKEQKLSNIFMLSLDLMIVVIFNILITFWFVMSKKNDSYFDNELKKGHASENNDNGDINVTKQNIIIKNSKDASDVNMIMSMNGSDQKYSQQSDDYDFGEGYKKLKAKKTKINGRKDNNTVLIKGKEMDPTPKISNNNMVVNSQRLQSFKRSPERNIFAIQNQYQPQTANKNGDVNFEERIQQPGMPRNQHQLSRATTLMQSRPALNRDLANKTLEFDEQKFEKDIFKNKYGQNKEQSDLPSDADQREENSQEDPSHLSQISVIPRSKMPNRNANKSNLEIKKELLKSFENQTVMRKNNNKRYMEASASKNETSFSGEKSEDLAIIIRQKIQESSIRQSQNITMLSNEENELEEISPSYYNVQNQRFQIEDLISSEQGQP